MAAKREGPLAPFAKLAPSVYIQEPVESADTRDSQPVIFIAFWMNAPARALAKYVVEYRRLLPRARIIFVRSDSNDFFLRATGRAQQARLTPAVDALRASANPQNPVFLHMFSNGGLSSTTHMLKAYRAATGKPLPISSMIVDSAPGTATIRTAMKAFSYVLPRIWILRLISKGMLLFGLVFGKLVRTILRLPDPVTVARAVINDRSLVQAANPKGVLSRCYIYSDADELVHWRDVESHADASEARGWIVRRELFQGAPHVSHMRAEPDRYWGIVREYLGIEESKESA
ncbi:hypothetical protein N7474_005975 [Penicillium riverlandense]|uniref:uncharacterized protein n=1 Tax=Penicillium riverlandense TaxID=1903569 RepID=UPI0025491E7E|nr:uncharacterized protein N7474_005975 [Penicillium riverlandense]KAJ5820384.1 hypothetical protein N7474_005975 [Penicillium riverlandense]